MIVAPRTFVHKDRFGSIKTMGPNRLIVLHTTEGGEGASSAEQLCQFLAAPGDRWVAPNDHSQGKFGSSYTWVLDTDRVIPAVPENVVSYSAPGANNDGIHIVFPGRASQSRDEWLDTVSSAYIDRCAELVVDISKRTAIPTTRVSVAQVIAKAKGLCEHHTISLAYHRTDHTDVGAFFPWDVLAARITALTQHPTDPELPPQEGETMQLGKKDGKAAVWQYDRKTRQWIPTEELLARSVAKYGSILPLSANLNLNDLGELILGTDPGDV